jgi:hypothetical protein
MRRASALILWIPIAACAGGSRRTQVAALGWSLGGEAHVFVAGDGFAREWYRDLTGSAALAESLAQKPLIAVDERAPRAATILSSHGAAPARLTLARFHAPSRCGPAEIVTELVFAFPPGGGAGRSVPPSNVTVVALVGGAPFAGGAGTPSPALSADSAALLIGRVARAADRRATLLAPLVADPERAADAGEVVPLPRQRYAVGFRARFLSGNDTVLVTGVAETDRRLNELRWVIRPVRAKLTAGMMRSGPRRYSLRGTVAGPGGEPLLLVNEIGDVSLRDSRATAVELTKRRVVAAQPLALRCP